MTPLQALELFSRWPASRRDAAFDYHAQFVASDGTVIDGWPEAAVSVLDLAGRLEDCRSDADLERELSEAVTLYIDSEIIPLDDIKARSFELVEELLQWGDSFVKN